MSRDSNTISAEDAAVLHEYIGASVAHGLACAMHSLALATGNEAALIEAQDMLDAENGREKAAQNAFNRRFGTTFTAG